VAKEADGEEYGRSGSPSLALNLQWRRDLKFQLPPRTEGF
jgi:hypothetical protein